MELLIGAIVIGWFLTKVPHVVADAIATSKAAAAGAWDVVTKDRAARDAAARRRAATRQSWAERVADAWGRARQKRHEDQGGTGQYPGLRAYWREQYRNWWQDRIDRARARRDVRDPYDPNGPSWQDRWDAAWERWQQRRAARHAQRDSEPGQVGQQPERPPEPASAGEEQPPNGQPDGGGIADTGPVISVVHDDDTYMPRRDLIATPADDVDSDCPRGTQCRICGQHVDAGDVCEDCATASQRPHPHPNGRCPYRPLRCCMDDTARTCDTCTDPTTCRTPDGTYRHPWCKPTPPDPTSQGDTVTAPTTDDAQEVNTNADLRRVFTGNQTDGRRLLELMTLSAAENATILREAQELEAYVASLNVDAGVAAAAADVKSHLIPQEQIDTWSERADQVVNTSADGLAALDKYHDTETKLANSNVDGATLSSTAA